MLVLLIFSSRFCLQFSVFYSCFWVGFGPRSLRQTLLQDLDPCSNCLRLHRLPALICAPSRPLRKPLSSYTSLIGSQPALVFDSPRC